MSDTTPKPLDGDYTGIQFKLRRRSIGGSLTDIITRAVKYDSSGTSLSTLCRLEGKEAVMPERYQLALLDLAEERIHAAQKVLRGE